MRRNASNRSRSGKGSRFSTPAIVVGSLLVALGLTGLGDTQAQAQRGDPKKHSRLIPNHDATELRILDWALWNVSKYYVEPGRIDPHAMTLAGLEALESNIAEVLVEPVGKGKRVRVRVGTAEREFQIGDVEALWAVGPHVREVFRFVNRSTQLDEDQQRQAEYAIVAGVLSTLDPHTNLLRPEDFADMKASTKGSFGGLGIEVGMREGNITVIRVIDGNPASQVDMQPGDRIVQIDAESTVTMNLNEAVGRLRGPPGTAVKLHVMRDGLQKPKPLEITRATIHLDSVIGEVLTAPGADGKPRKVGLVQIPRNFAQTTGKELREKLEQFAEANVEGVILDLRDNPGGLLNAAVEVADAFLGSGTIVSTVGVSSPREESRADDRYDFPNKPLVVLVDQGSASASEIVAGALRNLDRAVLMGRRTFGKGSVQVLHERKAADKELALKLTIAQYLTPGDVSIQSVGVSPDVETVPVWVGEESIYYFGRERFDLLREESLAAHLESETAKTQKTAYGPLYFLADGSVTDEKKEKDGKAKDSEEKRAEMLLEDPEIRMARDFLLWAPSPNRQELLARMDEFVKQQRTEEQDRIAKSLQTKGIDWSEGSEPQTGEAPSLAVTVESDRPSNVIKSGDKGKVTVTVKNEGTGPAYQVRAITDSDNRYFDERELLFGKIGPGETKTQTLTLAIPEHELSRTDRIDFHLFERHGAKLTSASKTSIDISAQGLERPQFAYGYQLIDSPRLGKPFQGNGDGKLQLGERAKLRVHVTNSGEGAALDTWVTLRNHSGEATFLHTGREHIEKLEPGESRFVEFDVEAKEMPEFGEAELQLTVSDNKLAEALSEKVVFAVGEEAHLVEPAKGGVELSSKAALHASPDSKSRVVARVDAGTRLPVSGKTKRWWRVELGDGAFAFVDRGSVQEAKKVARAGKVEFVDEVSPPRVTLMGSVTQTEDEAVHLSGVAMDEDALRDLYITVDNPSRNLFGDREKVFYQANPSPEGGRLEFSADVPLTPGNNLIEVYARQNDDVIAVKRMWVLRTSGLAEARAQEAQFATRGQLRVDTFQ